MAGRRKIAGASLHSMRKSAMKIAFSVEEVGVCPMVSVPASLAHTADIIRRGMKRRSILFRETADDRSHTGNMPRQETMLPPRSSVGLMRHRRHIGSSRPRHAGYRCRKDHAVSSRGNSTARSCCIRRHQQSSRRPLPVARRIVTSGRRVCADVIVALSAQANMAIDGKAMAPWRRYEARHERIALRPHGERKCGL